MKMVICSIQDSKAQAWLTPLFFQSNAQAVRSFGDAVNSDTDFAKHPEDYTLFQVGEFDPSEGIVLGISPVSLAVGVNLIRSE